MTATPLPPLTRVGQVLEDLLQEAYGQLCLLRPAVPTCSWIAHGGVERQQSRKKQHTLLADPAAYEHAKKSTIAETHLQWQVDVWWACGCYP
jgi:hypothetical protein